MSLEEFALQVFAPVCTSAIIGLWLWASRISKEITQLRIMIAEQYVHKDNLSEIKDDLLSLRDLTYRIALKLEVPIVTEKRW